jgi:hypothetical protein
MSAGLTVNRRELLEGLKKISKLVKKKGIGKGVLFFQDGALVVSLDGALIKASAEGDLPGFVRIGGLAVLSLTEALPPDDPLPIRVEGGRLFISKLSLPCEVDEPTRAIQIPMDAPLSTLLGLEYIYSDKEILRSGFAEKMNVARGQKTNLIRWASNKLAVLGVKREDIEELVDKALRRVNGIQNPPSQNNR